MAWNEPGGSGNKDPWSGRGGEQGPPDLDEMLRRFQNRLGGLFGRGPGAASAGGAPVAFVVLGVVLIVWFFSGVYIVDEGKRGVVLQFGAYKETTSPGLNWFPRFVQSVNVVDVESIRSIELGQRGDEALMLTQDENLVDIKFAVQYRVKDPREYLFNVTDPEQTLREVIESSVREVIGKSKMEFVLTTGRGEIAASAQKLVQETLDRYSTGLQITGLNMQNAQAPEQVQGAFADAIKAREDQERLINIAHAYSNEVVPIAKGDAARALAEAEAYKFKVIAEAEGESSRFLKVLAEYQKAPGVTRERMYLDALESVLSRSSKVVVDTKGGNNMIYLPMDKLMQRPQQTTPSATGASTAAPAVTEPAAATSGDLRARDDVRRREVR